MQRATFHQRTSNLKKQGRTRHEPARPGPFQSTSWGRVRKTRPLILVSSWIVSQKFWAVVDNFDNKQATAAASNNISVLKVNESLLESSQFRGTVADFAPPGISYLLYSTYCAVQCMQARASTLPIESVVNSLAPKRACACLLPPTAAWDEWCSNPRQSMFGTRSHSRYK